jgi:hypothetical protein
VAREQQQRHRGGRADDPDEPPVPAPERRGSTAGEASERADELIDDMDDLLDETDRALLENLEARDGAKITDPDVVRMIALAVRDFTQKGGQ